MRFRSLASLPRVSSGVGEPSVSLGGRSPAKGLEDSRDSKAKSLFSSSSKTRRRYTQRFLIQSPPPSMQKISFISGAFVLSCYCWSFYWNFWVLNGCAFFAFASLWSVTWFCVPTISPSSLIIYNASFFSHSPLPFFSYYHLSSWIFHISAHSFLSPPPLHYSSPVLSYYYCDSFYDAPSFLIILPIIYSTSSFSILYVFPILFLLVVIIQILPSSFAFSHSPSSSSRSSSPFFFFWFLHSPPSFNMPTHHNTFSHHTFRHHLCYLSLNHHTYSHHTLGHRKFHCPHVIIHLFITHFPITHIIPHLVNPYFIATHFGIIHLDITHSTTTALVPTT